MPRSSSCPAFPYSEAVTEKGTPCDVAVESASLRRRARELLDTDISRLARVEIEDADFQASDLMNRDNIVGRLSFRRRTGATQLQKTRTKSNSNITATFKGSSAV